MRSARDLLVGADGIHSLVQGVVDNKREPVSEGVVAYRGLIPALVQGVVDNKREPVSEGVVAYRGLIPAERLHGIDEMSRMAMWVGPGQSVLAFAVSEGALLTVVGFVATDLAVEESWSAPGDVAAFAAAYAGWAPTVLKVIGAMDSTFRWGIYDREPLTRWSTNRITLLGDSAQAVTPHLGQGANQVVEDAITLAVVVEARQKRRRRPRLTGLGAAYGE